MKQSRRTDLLGHLLDFVGYVTANLEAFLVFCVSYYAFQERISVRVVGCVRRHVLLVHFQRI